MQTIYSVLERTSTPVGFTVLVVLQVIVGWQISSHVAALADISGGNGILDFELGYTTEKVASIFDSYGPEGIEIYHSILFYDLFNPLIYSLLAASLFFVLVGRTRFSGLAPAPLLAALFDYLENGFLFAMSNAHPEIPIWIVEASSWLSVIKRGVMIFVFAVLLFVVAQWVWRIVRG